MRAIWINSAFGAGKTSVTAELQSALPDARVFDPEIIGSLMPHLGEAAETGDFQDIELWRRLVADTAIGLMDIHRADLIVPMTLVVESYTQAIVDRIAAAGHEVHMFWLSLPGDELRRRITAQVLIADDAERDAEVRQWRLDQVDRCQLAAGSTHVGLAVPNHDRPPAATAADILGRLRSS